MIAWRRKPYRILAEGSVSRLATHSPLQKTRLACHLHPFISIKRCADQTAIDFDLALVSYVM